MLRGGPNLHWWWRPPGLGLWHSRKVAFAVVQFAVGILFKIYKQYVAVDALQGMGKANFLGRFRRCLFPGLGSRYAEVCRVRVFHIWVPPCGITFVY